MTPNCTKVKYWTKSDAKRALKTINQAHHNDMLKTVYRCNLCDFWHLTSMNKTASRNFKRFLKNKFGG